MMEDRLKGVVEEADIENALKEVAEATTREKSTTIETAKERTREAKRVHIHVEQKVTDLEKKT